MPLCILRVFPESSRYARQVFHPHPVPSPLKGEGFHCLSRPNGMGGSFTEVPAIIFFNLTSCQFIYYYVLITIGYKEEGPYGKAPTVFIKFFAGIP